MATLANEDRFTKTWDGAVLALRAALGLMFLVAGLKLIIPAPFGLGNNRDHRGGRPGRHPRDRRKSAGRHHGARCDRSLVH